MPQIPLSQGRFALVDDADYPLLSEFKWCYRGERNKPDGYAVRHVKVDGKDRLCYLHRLIMEPPEGHEVIFLNHNKLDCRRTNLRVVSMEEARRHHRVRHDSTSGLKNIVYNRKARTWSVNLTRNGYSRRIGTYESKEMAIQAYEEALLKHDGTLGFAAPAAAVTPEIPSSGTTTDQLGSSPTSKTPGQSGDAN